MEPKIKAGGAVPTVGDEIYVAEDYFGNVRLYTGGCAKISKVNCSKVCGTIIHMLEVEGRPFINYNWEQYLLLEQKNLQKKFGDVRAKIKSA